MQRAGGATNERRGATLVLATVTIAALASVAMGYVYTTTSHSKEQSAAHRNLSSFYAAEAGLNDSYIDMTTGGTGALGRAAAPVPFGSQSYWIDAIENGDGTTTLLSTGADGDVTSRAELVVSTAPLGQFQFAAFADEGLLVESGALIDSYDSAKGTYASQVDGGRANDNGDVGSNDDVTLDSNSQIYGAGQYGPDSDDTITVSTNVTIVGGYGPSNEEVALDPVTVPVIPSTGALMVAGGTSTVLGPGDVHLDSVQVKSGGKLVIQGPARVVLDSVLVRSNAAFAIDGTSGPVEVYGTGDFVLSSNSIFASTANEPTDVSLMLTGVHDSEADTTPRISLNSNTDFYGTFYAPELAVTVESNFEIYGAIQSRWLTLASNAQVHYDERLRYDETGGAPTFEVLLWRPLSAAQFDDIE
jgi:hypothetical protein